MTKVIGDIDMNDSIYLSDKILEECQNGKPCEYGICDECPNTRGDCNA